MSTQALPQVGALDVNGFDSTGTELGPRMQELVRRRDAALGPSYHLMYRDPVELVRGEGVHLWDHEGRRYLDMYNNVASVGHSNPRVAEAVARKLSEINTHTRYLHEDVIGYAENLLSTFPAELSVSMFTCTGSEANDLALRIARTVTGAQGVIVTDNAYHGGTVDVAACSPSMGSGSTPGMQPPWLRIVKAPDCFREGDQIGANFAARITEAVADLQECGIGVAALLVDSAFTSDGVQTENPPFLSGAVEAVRRAGALLIADEVQPGFGRLGDSMWGFERHAISPDLVTLGKPMGNGIPVAGVIARREWAEKFGQQVRYFNTFGGNPVAIAAAQTVLDEIAERQLIAHSAAMGLMLKSGLQSIASEHNDIAQVRGSGLFLGVEFVSDLETATPDPARAIDVVNGLRDCGVLISATGFHGNTLKVRPPLVIEPSDIAFFLEQFADVVST